MKMKIKIKDLLPFELLASYTECSTEQAVQEAYKRMLDTGNLTNAERDELQDLSTQNAPPIIVEVDIELNSRQSALLDKIMMNRSIGEINDKVFELAVGYLSLTTETQMSVDRIIDK